MEKCKEKKRAFLAVILVHGEDGTELAVQDPIILLAKDEKSAYLQAARLIPEKYAKKSDDVDVQIRPF